MDRHAMPAVQVVQNAQREYLGVPCTLPDTHATADVVYLCWQAADNAA